MMVDADGFKQINDNYGHDAGDEVLRQLSKNLRFSMRTDDIVCRLGGDEFLIICPQTSQEGALNAAEFMRQTVATLRIQAEKGVWKGSVSIGVASRSPDMQGPEDLIKAADEGVYIAKRNGRNCVACAELNSITTQNA
jgi:hemerythrin